MLLPGVAEPQISFGRMRLTLTVSSGPRKMRTFYDGHGLTSAEGKVPGRVQSQGEDPE